MEYYNLQNVLALYSVITKILLMVSTFSMAIGQRITSTNDGYLLHSAEEHLSTDSSPEILECPSANIFRVKYKCPGPSNTWIDCIKSQCCPRFILINQKCYPQNVDICNLNLCEQKCSIVLKKVICTCFDGYKFDEENQKTGKTPTCLDVDECQEKIDDCHQICVNTPGGFSCDCHEGYFLLADNKTCEKKIVITDDGKEAANDDEKIPRLGTNSECVPSCGTVQRLKERVSRLSEQLAALETAVAISINSLNHRKMSVLSDKHGDSAAAFNDFSGSKSYPVFDSFVQVGNEYCKCQRGPIGPPGPPGMTGQKGATGEKGSRGTKGADGNIDFLLLILADIRHDISQLQEKVFPGQSSVLKSTDLNGVSVNQRNLKDFRKAKNDNKNIEDFGGSDTVRVSDYAPEEGIIESSGDEWDHYGE